jgi:hypothetical protein
MESLNAVAGGENAPAATPDEHLRADPVANHRERATSMDARYRSGGGSGYRQKT